MALPQFWLGMNRKDLAERALVERREHEAQLTQRRESAAKYHRDLNLLSSQYKNLEENPHRRKTRVNDESRISEELRAKRKEKLHERQRKLAVLLHKENEQFFLELKALSNEENADPWSITKLKEQIEQLKQQRKEDEEMLRRSSMHHMYHESKLPYMKEYEQRLLQNEVVASLEQQKKQLQQQVAEKQIQEREKKEKLEEMLQKAQQDVEACKAEKMTVTKKWEEQVKSLVRQIENNKIKNDQLNFGFEVLENYENAVEGITSRRKEILDIQQQRIEKISNFRPSKEKVRKLAIEVRHRYNLDLGSLNFLTNLVLENGENKHNICLDNVNSAEKSIKEKLAAEDVRNADLQVMFEEEAKKLWQENKSKWDEEMKIHNDLMHQVLESFVNEILRKKQEYLSTQKNVLDSQEKLIDQLSALKDKSKDEIQLISEKEEFFSNQVQELRDKLKKFETCAALLRNT